MTLDLPDMHAPAGDLAFLLGVLFNQQIRAETAWKAPARLAQRLTGPAGRGGLDPAALAAADPVWLAGVMRQRPAVHPFAVSMARHVTGICGQLVDDYGGRACNVWAGRPRAAVLLDRLTRFPGIGRHKATVAIALLTCEYGVPLTGPAGTLTDQALSSCPRLREVLLT
ncbi:hypothetical protein AGRA3207_007334 [Actinomadura graeca]|uniref:HhH-GPD domain-containing protein n=1 Tax=Actinomadura graeca TaxID=2750812 RepID=A0ABX8R409_9ACTN|nr:hypothetical protein [Actinomadura graeca]QXJ25784.1 hypothetical protein AGRA3207_007334 [Actinomadura graeca]